MQLTFSDLSEAVALLAVLCYVLGLLIVNIQLSKYGFSSLGLLRAKYLSVGIIFILIQLTTIASSIPLAYALSLLHPFVIFFLVIPEYILLAIVAYIFVIRPLRLRLRTSLFIVTWYISSIVLYSLPLRIFAYPIAHAPGSSVVYDSIGLSVLLSVLIVQVAGFGRYFYGVRISNERRAVFPGIFAPASVEILFQENIAQSIQKTDLPLVSPHLSRTLLLLDETQTELVVATAPSESRPIVVRLAKHSIVAIRYLP